MVTRIAGPSRLHNKPRKALLWNDDDVWRFILANGQSTFWENQRQLNDREKVIPNGRDNEKAYQREFTHSDGSEGNNNGNYDEDDSWNRYIGNNSRCLKTHYKRLCMSLFDTVVAVVNRRSTSWVCVCVCRFFDINRETKMEWTEVRARTQRAQTSTKSTKQNHRTTSESCVHTAQSAMWNDITGYVYSIRAPTLKQSSSSSSFGSNAHVHQTIGLERRHRWSA